MKVHQYWLTTFTTLCVISLISVLSLTTALPWQTYSAQNTASTRVWYFQACYSQLPTPVPGVLTSECDSFLPINLLYGALGIDGASFLILVCLVATVTWRGRTSLTTGSSFSAVAWGIWPVRCLALSRAAHVSLLVSALVIKDGALPHNSWVTRNAGHACLAASIALSILSIITLFGLVWRELWDVPLYVDTPKDEPVLMVMGPPSISNKMVLSEQLGKAIPHLEVLWLCAFLRYSKLFFNQSQKLISLT